MDKKAFINRINNIVKNLSVNETRMIIEELLDFIPHRLYEKCICKIENELGLNSVNILQLEQEIKEVRDYFKKINSSEICFRCYSYNTGNYGFYGEEDYEYYTTPEMAKSLDIAYNLGRKLVYYKEYAKAIEVFDLILYSEYCVEEVGNPEYDDTEDVYDTFYIDLSSAKTALDFDYDYVCLFCIYAVLMGNYKNQNEKIYNYLKQCSHSDLEKALNLGIEKIKLTESFYKRWNKFLESKKD